MAFMIHHLEIFFYLFFLDIHHYISAFFAISLKKRIMKKVFEGVCMKKIRIIFCIIMSVGMVALASCLNEKEIIFPEIAALLIGAWAADTQPWRVTKFRLWFLMTISAIVGIMIVRYVDASLYLQIMLAFTYAVFAILGSRCSLVPLISACILPVIMKTETLVYPIAVSVMCAIIVLVQWWMEEWGLRESQPYIPYICDKEGYETWLKRYVIVGIYTLLAVHSHQMYLIAPPLYVTFVELSNRRSPLRSSRYLLAFVMLLASLIGFFAKVLQLEFQLPITLCALIAMVLLFTMFKKTYTFFPPAGAIALLPLILPYENILLYPIEVGISSCAFIFLAMSFFKKGKNYHEV